MAKNKYEENMIIRVKTGWPGPFIENEVGVTRVSPGTYQRLLDSDQAVEICGNSKEVQIASFMTAAKHLDVKIGSEDEDIIEAAKRYGVKLARITSKTKKTNDATKKTK